MIADGPNSRNVGSWCKIAGVFNRKAQECSSFTRRYGTIRQNYWNGGRKKTQTSKARLSALRQMASMQEKGGQRDWDRWYQLKITLDEAYKAEA